MSDHDEVYGERRMERLLDLLRRLGDLRSELFHYEVRATYDSPEVAAHRRLVEEAEQSDPFLHDDPEDDQPWRTRPAD